MIYYARPELADEVERADWRVQVQLRKLAELAEELGVDVEVTCAERTLAETQALYREAGRIVPEGPGVHDVRPVCGIDAIPKGRGVEEVPIDVGPSLEFKMNELFRYPRKHQKACMWHDVTGAHWHLQVPSWGEGIEMRLDTDKLPRVAEEA